MKIIYPLYLLPLLLGLAIFSCPSPKKNSTQPNVLFLSIDDLRPTLGVYGDAIAITPNIDQLAAEGITFRRTLLK